MGHARALLALDSPSLQLKLFRDVQKNQYSVRKVEEMVQMLKQGEDVQTAKKKITAKAQLPAEMVEARQQLADMLKAKVQLTCSANGKGKISIPFADAEELKRIMDAITKA
jgi:ParB family chromosome partitioning protein